MRCGKCAAVFDGVASLLVEESAALLADQPSPQLGLFDAREASPVPEPATEVVASPPTPLAMPILGAQPAEQPHLEPATETPSPALETPSMATPKAPVTVTTVQNTLAPVPEFLLTVRPRASYTLVWALLALLASIVLVAQTVLHFRTEIAVLMPLARTHLETACEMLGCEVRSPRRADLMSIESSDLQADTQRQGVIVLNALLRNRAPFVQEYPDLELTLTDQGDQALIRRVLKPSEYLQPNRAVQAQGIAGGAEESVRIHLDIGGLFATGYQLFLFYPCPPAGTSAIWQLSHPVRCQDLPNR